MFISRVCYYYLRLLHIDNKIKMSSSPELDMTNPEAYEKIINFINKNKKESQKLTKYFIFFLAIIALMVTIIALITIRNYLVDVWLCCEEFDGDMWMTFTYYVKRCYKEQLSSLRGRKY